MRKNKFIIFCLTIVVLIGCDNVSYTYEVSIDYEAPNWTSDGKVVFIKDSNYVKIAHGAMGSEEWNVKGSKEILTLCEINSDGTGFTEKGEVLRSEDYAYALGVTGLSSAGDWVTFGIEGLHIYVANRDGTNVEEIGEGTYPDFSPDASQIVYQKPNQGIWIMDRDGGNDRQIIADANAKYPAWSPDDTLIAYGEWKTNIVNINGDSVKSYANLVFLDWGPIDSNCVLCQPYYGLPIVLDIVSGSAIDSLEFGAEKWSADGLRFIGRDENGYYIIDRNGYNKKYFNP